jgi:hypothetical protein
VLLVTSKLRPGKFNRWRVAPICTYEDGLLIESTQVEVMRPGKVWEAANETWQSILAFNGVSGVKQAVTSNGGCYVMRAA